MARLKIETQLSGEKTIKDLKDMGKSVDALAKSGEEAGKSLQDMLKERNAHTNFRKQLSEIQKQLTDLTITYRELNEVDRNSEFGSKMAQQISELTSKAQLYKDAIGDVQQSISTGSSDTLYWDAMKEGIDVASTSLQAFAGMIGLSSDQTEKLVKALLAMQTVEKTVAAVQKIVNAFQAQSSIMQAINALRLRSVALTTSEAGALSQNTSAVLENELALVKSRKAQHEAMLAAEEGTIVTSKETIQKWINADAAKAKALSEQLNAKATLASAGATKVLNAAMKANPVGAAIVAIMALVGAYKLLTKHSREAAEAEKKAAEQRKEAETKANNTVATSVGNVVGAYKLLQKQYSQMASETEKLKWIEKNKSSLDQLNLAINDVNSADDVFIRQSEAVVAALKARAKAEGVADAYKQAVADATTLAVQKEKEALDKAKEDGKGRITQSTVNKAGLVKDVDYTEQKVTTNTQGIYGAGQTDAYIKTLTEEGVKKMAEYYRNIAKTEVDAADELADMLGDMMVTSENEAQQAMAKVHDLFNENANDDGNNNADKGIKAMKGSLQEAMNLVSDLDTKLKNTTFGTDAWYKLNDELKKAQDNVDKLKAKIERVDLKPIEKLPELKPIKVQAEVQKPKGIKVLRKSIVEQYEDAKKDIQKVLDFYDMGLIHIDVAQDDIDNINSKLKSLGLKPIPINLKMEKFEASLDGIDDVVGGLSDMNSAVNGLYNSWSGLGDAMDEAENGFEEFMAVADVAFNTLQSGLSIISNITSLMQTMNALQAASSATKASTAAATSAEAAAHAENAAAIVTETAAQKLSNEESKKGFFTKMSEAIAGAVKSMSSIPMVGPVLGLAAGATITAFLMSRKKFATGGIVGGNSFSGDKVLAGLNSGEAVLNKHQQKRLFDLLDSNSPVGSNGTQEISWTIDGTKLKGVLSNVDKRRGRV